MKMSKDQKQKGAIGTIVAVLFVLASSLPSFAQDPLQGNERGFEAFRKNVYPLLMQHCAECHSEQGPGPAHSVSDPKQSYLAIRGYISNFMDLKSSKLVKAGTRADMAGDTIKADELVTALQKWWDEGENTTFLSSKKMLSSQKIPALPQNGGFTAMKWNLGEVSPDLNGLEFKVDIQRFAQPNEKSTGAYRIRNPRVVANQAMNVLAVPNQMIDVEGVHLVVNGVWNSMANTYASVRALIPSTGSDGVLSRSHQIVLAMNGEGNDEISFAFGKLELSQANPMPVQPGPAPSKSISTKITKADLKAFGGVFNEEKVGKAARFVTITASPEHPIEFDMGSPPEIASPYGDEALHRVRLTKGFEIQATKTTQLQWYLVMPKGTNLNPSYFKDKSQCDDGSFPTQKELDDGMPPMCKHHPVEQVSWEDICGKIRPEKGEKCGDQDGFIRRLNSLQSEYTYRLATESEREYIAHAGLPPEYAYGWGNDFDGQYAWYDGNSNKGSQSKEYGGKRTHAVATTVPTPSPQNESDEIYDIAGNVWEWVSDWRANYLYSDTDRKILWPWVQTQGPGNYLIVDPVGPPAGSFRVLRGGGWFYVAAFCRAAQRFSSGPDNRFIVVGFRLVRTPR